MAKKSCSTTPDRSSKAQLFGRRSPPPPSRTYGRKSKIRSHPNTPSQPPIALTSSTPLPNNNSPAVSSSTRSNFHLHSLALDYEEPILIPATSSPSSNSMSSPSNSTSEVSRLFLPPLRAHNSMALLCRLLISWIPTMRMNQFFYQW